MRNVSDKICRENRNEIFNAQICFFFSKIVPFLKNRAVYEMHPEICRTILPALKNGYKSGG